MFSLWHVTVFVDSWTLNFIFDLRLLLLYFGIKSFSLAQVAHQGEHIPRGVIFCNNDDVMVNEYLKIKG